MSGTSSKRSRSIIWLLIALPLWLLVSGIFAIWYFHHHEEQESRIEQQRFSQAVSEQMLADDLRKIVEVIGERHPSSETAARNLSRMAAMIEGLLGPSNTGYTVERVDGPSNWPLLHILVKGKSPQSPTVWIVTSYDSKPGSPGAEQNASGLAATLAAAQALAIDAPDSNIRFAFLPHANDPGSPILETLSKFKELAAIKKVTGSLLYVESMGINQELWLSSRDSSAPALSLNDGLGAVHGAEVICLTDDLDISSMMFEIGLPAVRVATGAPIPPDVPDNRLPAAATVASSTGRLLELIRRCARLP